MARNALEYNDDNNHNNNHNRCLNDTAMIKRLHVLGTVIIMVCKVVAFSRREVTQQCSFLIVWESKESSYLRHYRALPTVVVQCVKFPHHHPEYSREKVRGLIFV